MLYKTGTSVRADRDLADAIFLSKHPNFKPEDMGYPAGDYILIDLLRLLDG